jgi:hypothetical protein
MAAMNSKMHLPELDPKAFSRNQKTAWLLYLDKLTAWLWQDNEGAARWTLILDDVLRRASINHPPRTVAGLKIQVTHQSRLKHALVHAFASHYPTTISLHPNTEALDASGNIVPFGTNLLRAIGIEIVPEDTDGVTRAHLELLRQIKTFPGLQHGLNPLKAWCDRILLLFNDLGRLTAPIDQNQTLCSHLDMLISSYGTPPTDPVSWNRCKDLLKSNAAYVAAPSVSLYLQHLKRFAGDHVASKNLLHDGPAHKTRGHFKAAYSAEALCWICGSANHDPRQCKMLTSALADYRSKHLHKGSSRGGGGFRNNNSRGRPSGRGGFTSRNNARGGHHGDNNARGGHHGVHKTKQFKNRKPENKTVNFRHHGTHAANAVLPPPAYTPPLSETTMPAEEHFAFRATCEHEDQDMYNVYPTCKGATFLKDEDKDERKRIYHEIFGSDDSDPEDSNYEAEEETMPPLCDDSSDDEDDERPPTSQVPKIELDPATRMLLNAGAETTDIDNKDPLTQPEPNDDPNLHVTFSDDEEDEDNNVLPFPRYFLHLGWETKLGFHDHIPLESAIYDIEDVQLHIKGPLILATITDHPAYYFLTQVKDELIRLGDEIKSSKYLHPEGIAEIHFDLGLLSAKVLHYAGHYGCSTSPSWTLAKDVPNDIINAIITSGVNAPLLIHMAQMHIYYMAYIETFWPHLDTTTLRHAQFQFLGEEANARTTIYTGYIITYKDNLVLTHRIDHEAMDNWERELNAPHADDGPPCKRRRIGDYEPGDDEPERYSPTSPAYCP